MEVLLKNEFKRWISNEYLDYNEISSNPYKLSETNFLTGPYYSESHKHWTFKKAHEGEEIFKKNYGNPSFHILFRSTTLVLEESEDKVSIKFFINTRQRPVGKIFFKKVTHLRFITYNKKTNDLYVGEIRNYHKKRKRTKTLRKNNYYTRPINSFTNFLSNHFNEMTDLLLKNKLDKNSIIKTYIHTFLSKICGNDEITRVNDFHFNGDKVLYKKNMVKKGIKCPDNYEVFMEIFPLPKKIEAKKVDYKLINLVMQRNKLEGGKIKKILHKLKNFNPDFYKYSVILFGDRNIKSLSDEYLIKIFESNYTSYNFPWHSPIFSLDSEKELKNALEIFKLVIKNEINISTFEDHIRFYDRLKSFEPVKWKSTTKKEFSEEHLMYTEKVELYSRGTYYRIYDDNFEKIFKQNIIIGQDTYSPVLLKDSKSYIEESATQSNCVKTYVNRVSSIIISLRRLDERATIEYNYYKEKNKLVFSRVQTLGKYNSSLDSSWNEALHNLDKKIYDFSMTNDFELPEITIVFKNGVSSTTKAIINENNNYATWENQYFDNSLHSDYIPIDLLPI